MPTDDNEDINDTPEMRRLLEGLSKLSPEKRQRLWKLVEDAINGPPPSEGEDEKGVDSIHTPGGPEEPE